MACGNCKKNAAKIEQKPKIVIVDRKAPQNKIAPKINKKIKLYM